MGQANVTLLARRSLRGREIYRLSRDTAIDVARAGSIATTKPAPYRTDAAGY
jgi:hypothetical protein